MDNSKFIEIKGEVIDRIHNPKRISKSGNSYSVNYLIIKWVTGPTGEYTDYMPIRTLNGSKLEHIRVGYIVKVNVLFSCNNFNSTEIKFKNNTHDEVTWKEPCLYPSFMLQGDIEVLDSTNNFEENNTNNDEFKKDVLDKNFPNPKDENSNFKF